MTEERLEPKKKRSKDYIAENESTEDCHGRRGRGVKNNPTQI